ncbi:MAG: DUF4190 domain-containing protein [Acidobacteria bacterium]|nr:DUF4190 domain-containing protein [Acidobacteriota bacterium]
MKICPICRQTYSDDNLNFCLNDGNFLESASGASDNAPKTLYMDPPRVTDQTNWNQTNFPPTAYTNQSQMRPPQTGAVAFASPINAQEKTLPIISMVVGILAVLIGCCYGGIPLGTGAIIVGLIALNQQKSDPGRYGGRGMAIAGIVTGAIGLSISLMVILLSVIK